LTVWRCAPLLRQPAGKEHAAALGGLLRTSAGLRVHMLCPDSKYLNRGVKKWGPELTEHVPDYGRTRERPRQFIYDDEVVHYKYPRAGGVMKLQWQPR
jgi:hypothetical protein